jgi:hypothetical protein
MAQAARQHGVISTAKLRRFGRRKPSGGGLRPGSFDRCSSACPRRWLAPDVGAADQAAVRWGGDGTVASYESAAALWRFDGFGLNTNIADLQNQCSGESRWADSIPVRLRKWPLRCGNRFGGLRLTVIPQCRVSGHSYLQVTFLDRRTGPRAGRLHRPMPPWHRTTPRGLWQRVSDRDRRLGRACGVCLRIEISHCIAPCIGDIPIHCV